MKKSLILASLLVFTVSIPCFAADTPPLEPAQPMPQLERPAPPDMHKPPKKGECKRAEFEKRLKLTDEQKAKAREIRVKGHEAMRPVMEQIKSKYQEIDAVRRSKMATAAQNEKIVKLKGEIRELKKQAHDLRVKNMQEFESILNKKQLKELRKMKAEGRKKFEKQFKKHHGNSNNPQFRPLPPEDDRADFPPPPPPHNGDAR